jgi:hypothetical protein
MSKATLNLASPVTVSKLDTTDWSRELWRAAYRQSRAMIRDRRTTTTATAYVWALDHLRRRFGASGWPVAQAAASLVFERRIVSGAATGSVADLERQGLIRATAKPRRGNLIGVVPYRCVSLERVRGLNFAWGGDDLACVNRNVALRRQRARQLREERRQVMAQLEAEERLYVLTDLGRAALVAAGLAADRVALTPRGSRAPV